MKDLNDNATIDLIQTANISQEPKKRGRPATGKAKTAAERQEAYRRNRRNTGELGMVNLNVWVDLKATCGLNRLMKHFNLSKAEMLEKLMRDADNALI